MVLTLLRDASVCRVVKVLHTLVVMHACLADSETGQTVAVESRCERPEPLWPGVDSGLLG